LSRKDLYYRADESRFALVDSAPARQFEWLRTGTMAFDAMVRLIHAAQKSIRFEMYIYRDDVIGKRICSALLGAVQRGVVVKVLIDAVGSQDLDKDFWLPLKEAGAEVRWFNPFRLDRFAIRNHRKLLLCDDSTAIIGGFNAASEYDGDGVAAGWCDLGAIISGPSLGELGRSFDLLFHLAEFRHSRLAKWRKSKAVLGPGEITGDVLLNLPGRGFSPLKGTLYSALAKAKKVQIISAYFLPTWRIRRYLQRIARSGGQVQIILAGKSDVQISQSASRSLYRTLMQSGVEIYEYEPQILHAKMYLIDDCVYVGSANLDKRSLGINYELLVRFADPGALAGGREIFASCLKHSLRITWAEWAKSRSLWTRLVQKLAYFFLVHLDPYIARQQLRMLR
jgi:cardiolipin synthase